MSVARALTSAEELARHDAWLAGHPQGSLWQSAAWRRYQEALGRKTQVYVVEFNGTIMAAASVIIDATAGGYSVWECPRGPVWTDPSALERLVDSVEEHARQQKCLSLLLSPAAPLPPVCPGLRSSGRHVHPQATLILDIAKSDDEILAQMHPKGRYNIRVAEKQGVIVESSSDISAFYGLLTGTGARDGFKIHQKSHYARFVESLGQSFLLMATHENRPVAGLLGTVWNGTGIYYYGASSYEDRALMAPYALQWAAIRHCKGLGCTRYDLLGIDAPGLPATAWKGITDFKRKFGGATVLYPAEQRLTLRPLASLALALKRKILG